MTCLKIKLLGHAPFVQLDCQACPDMTGPKQSKSILQITTKVKLWWAFRIETEPAVASHQIKKNAALRKKKARGHTPVQVVPTEMNLKRRGNIYYCSKCLSKIEKGNSNHNWDLTCRQHLQKQAKKDDRYCRLKSAWWFRLQAKQPQHATNLSKAVGKTFDQITAIFAKAKCWTSKRDSPPGANPLDCWHLDLTAHGDIHPHPGPDVQIWSCNCGRGTGAIEFFEHARKSRIPILAIQEDGLKPGERQYFQRHVNNYHYRMFDGPSRIRHKNAWGGVIILVEASLRCRLIDQLSEDEGQVVTVMVENIAISNLYQPPQESRLHASCHIFETLQILPPGTPWICFGDFNDCPDENVLLFEDDSIGLQCCFVKDAQGEAVSSRWSSNRCIDYAVTNAVHNVQQVLYDTEAISDHKTFCCTFQMPSHCKPTPMYRLTRHDDLSKPETCSLEDWHAACCDFLSLNPALPAPIHGTQQSIDEYWSCLSDHFEAMLRAARRSFHEPDVRTVTKKVGLSFLKVFRLFTVNLTKPLTLFVFAIYETCLSNWANAVNLRLTVVKVVSNTNAC